MADLEERGLTPLRLVGAVVAGLILAGLPIARFVFVAGHGAAHGPSGVPHADHEPHHGGQLGMVGDHHIEVVRRDGTLAVHLSDARRAPLVPRQGWAAFDRLPRTRLRRVGGHLTTKIPAHAVEVTIELVTTEGTVLRTTFDLAAAACARPRLTWVMRRAGSRSGARAVVRTSPLGIRTDTPREARRIAARRRESAIDA